ncbi:hypothetical protein VCHA53O466_50270 [Vibrio chagasii]|nr:hypothetical protein VCHA53O466_50270 [Vibrio chagasii]
MSTLVKSKFQVKFAVGLCGGVAVLEVSETRLPLDGESLEGDPYNSFVREDIESYCVTDWIQNRCPNAELPEELGHYSLSGLALLDEDSSSFEDLILIKESLT